jgi:hypothetical protein
MKKNVQFRTKEAVFGQPSDQLDEKMGLLKETEAGLVQTTGKPGQKTVRNRLFLSFRITV